MSTEGLQFDGDSKSEETDVSQRSSLTHPAPLGLDAMTQTWPRLRLYAFPPIAPGSTGESSPGPGPTTSYCPPWWPGRVCFPNLFSLLDGPPLELPVRRDLLSQAGGSIFHPPSRTMETVGLASEGVQLINSCLSTRGC